MALVAARAPAFPVRGPPLGVKYTPGSKSRPGMPGSMPGPVRPPARSRSCSCANRSPSSWGSLQKAPESSHSGGWGIEQYPKIAKALPGDGYTPPNEVTLYFKPMTGGIFFSQLHWRRA